ncbi:hypothetical protein [Microtetraspora malaysiensis]|uniref:hypothetical protein n=1 Tax=Microtetraspora malaysiensis TaxID=161358 RepID=UPI003D89E636
MSVPRGLAERPGAAARAVVARRPGWATAAARGRPGLPRPACPQAPDRAYRAYLAHLATEPDGSPVARAPHCPV